MAVTSNNQREISIATRCFVRFDIRADQPHDGPAVLHAAHLGPARPIPAARSCRHWCRLCPRSPSGTRSPLRRSIRAQFFEHGVCNLYLLQVKTAPIINDPILPSAGKAGWPGRGIPVCHSTVAWVREFSMQPRCSPLRQSPGSRE